METKNMTTLHLGKSRSQRVEKTWTVISPFTWVVVFIIAMSSPMNCGAQSPSPSVRLLPEQAGIGMPDPQIAVGHKYVLAIDSGNLSFYDKSTKQWLSSLPWLTKSSPATLTATDLFQPMFKAINEYLQNLGLPSNVCDPNDPDHDYKFDPKHPNKCIPGNVYEAYDTRVFYDTPRHRFWIASAVRNALWPCLPNSSGCPVGPGAQIGGFSKISKETLLDPDPGDPNCAKRHPDWEASWAHRFIAVAVSQVDSHGNEDLSKPFRKYVLVDEYNDWPQMTVNNNYLILNHGPTTIKPPTTFVFDAESLANGEKNGTVMRVKPLAKFAHDKFVASVGLVSYHPTTNWIYPVNTFGSSDRLTYLISGTLDGLLVFALSSPSNNPSGKPTLLNGAFVPLGYTYHGPACNPVFRNGKLYIAAHRKALFLGTASLANYSSDLTVFEDPRRYYTRVIRIPVSRSSDGSAVHYSEKPEHGFFDVSIGNNDADRLSYIFPSVGVNKNDDMVIAYERIGAEFDTPQNASVRYDAFYHNETQIRHSVALQEGGALGPGEQVDIPDIDLPGTAIDPQDDLTVWIANAYGEVVVEGGKRSIVLHSVIGAVKP
jgi:hypothetical protein